MREVNRLGRPPHMRGRTHTRPGRVVSRALASAYAETDSTATGRCASRRTRTARGSRGRCQWFPGNGRDAPPRMRGPHRSGLLRGLAGRRACARAGAALPSRLAGHGSRPGARGTPSTGETTLSPWASPRPAPGLSPGALPRASSDARALDVTWPVAPGCLSRPTGLRRRGAPHPGSHSGGTPSFARATDLGLPKTLGRLGKGSVIGFPNPRESSRPAVTTM